MFNNVTPIANNSWFVGHISLTSFTALAAADTMASHTGWTEFTGYSQSTRVAWASGAAASQVAAIVAVRDALLVRQRAFATSQGLVADGRDMGTVVFPTAPLKFYLTASAQERAKRRYQQLLAAGESVNIESILKEVQERDARDTGRAIAPLKPATDAIVIDSTHMDVAAVMSVMLQHIEMRQHAMQ